MLRALMIVGVVAWSRPAVSQSPDAPAVSQSPDAPAVSQSPDAPATLRIRAEPAGAVVTVDGALVGTSAASDLIPVVAPDLSPRLHFVEIDKGGHRPWREHIEVGPGEQLELDVKLGNEQPWTSKFLVYTFAGIGLAHAASGVALGLRDEVNTESTVALISAGAVGITLAAVIHWFTRDTDPEVQLSRSSSAPSN